MKIVFSAFSLLSLVLTAGVSEAGFASRSKAEELETKEVAAQATNSATAWAVWDDQCTKLSTPPLGGCGPLPERRWGWGDPGNPGIKCRQGAKSYTYTNLGKLTIEHCADNRKSEDVHEVTLTEVQRREVEIMLRALQSTQLHHTGIPLPADKGSDGPWFSVVRIDEKTRAEETRIFVGKAPDGPKTPKHIDRSQPSYTYGTQPDLKFLRAFDKLAGLTTPAPVCDE
jgi:hypothetical protein